MTMHYISYIPKKPPQGRALMHNHIMHDLDTMPGANGFRVWLDDKPTENFTVCPCGWASKAGEHYAHRDYVAALH